MPGAATSLLSRWLAFAAGLALLLLFPLYRLWSVLFAEVGLTRALGTFGGVVTPLLVVALLLALATRRIVPGAALARGLRVAVFAVFVLDLLGIGGILFYYHPRLAPGPVQVGALVAMVLAVWAYARLDAENQRPAQRLAMALGLVVYGLPLAAAPLVIVGASRDQIVPRTARPLAHPERLAHAPRRVVLVVVDALRRLSTGLDPGLPQATPHLRALAASSTEFTRAIAPSDATLLSMPVMLTGADITTVAASRPRDAIDWLPASYTGFAREGELTGIAAHLRPGGYRSYYATMLVTPRLFGMENEYDAGYACAYGFPSVDNSLNRASYLPIGAAYGWLAGRAFGRSSALEPAPDGPDALERTLAAAAGYYQRPDERAFVRVHVGMPHEPFYPIAKDPRTGRLSPVAGKRIEFADVERARTEAEVEGLRHSYRDNVAYMDQALGDFLAKLSASPLWEDTLLVLTADHGVEFRLGLPSHGTGAASEKLNRVPLLVHQPHQRAGRRDERLATAVDVVPTMLAQVYAHPPAMDGIDLFGPAEPDRIVGSWGLYKPYAAGKTHERAIAAYQGRYKYVVRYPGRRAALYDLSHDAKAQVDVSAAHPEVAARLGAWVERNYRPPAS